MPFRDAYDHVKKNLKDLGMPAKDSVDHTGLDLDIFRKRISADLAEVHAERKSYHRSISGLLGVTYPELG
jgi:hypothetical protein